LDVTGGKFKEKKKKVLLQKIDLEDVLRV